MFALLLRPNRGQKRLPRRLGVEILEIRDCPASLTLETLVLPGHEIQLSGAVVGDFTPGSTVTFDGAVNGQCVLDSAGQYLFTTTAGSLGQVRAVGIFANAAFTDPVANMVATPAPTISLAISDMNAKMVTFTGTLTSIDAAGQDIPIPGSFRCATTDAQGNFSFTLPRNNPGVVEVSTTDLWGQPSNIAQANVPAAPPIIVMTAVQCENSSTWTFQGWVYGSNVAGLTVIFSVNDTFVGQATVDANGWYTFDEVFDQPPTGFATAMTTTPDGVSSNPAIWNF